MTSDNLNPLSQILGGYIRAVRKSIGKSSKSFSKEFLSVSDSFLRMIESGRTNIPLSRIDQFLEGLLKADKQIEFEKLLKLVASIHYMESKNKSGTPYNDSFFHLAKIDGELEKLFFTLKELSEGIGKTEDPFNSMLMFRQLESFLTGEMFLSNDDEDGFKEHVVSEIEDVPSLLIGPLMNYVSTLVGRPPLHIRKKAVDWELENAEKFTEVVGIFSSTEYIISEKNLNEFHHPYLFLIGFRRMNFIFLNSKRTGKELKVEYFEILQEKINRTRKDIVIDQSVHQKVDFKVVDRSDYPSEIAEILAGDSNFYPDIDVFWGFKLDNGEQIAFVGVEQSGKSNDPSAEQFDPSKTSTLNLSYKESRSRISKFNQLWQQL